MIGHYNHSYVSLVPTKFWLMLLVVYILTSIGFSGSCIFYDAFLVDVTTEERMDYVSSMGFALGYIGSTIPFIICMAVVMLAQFNALPISVTKASQLAFIITAIWWAVYICILYKNHLSFLDFSNVSRYFSRGNSGNK